MHPVNETPSDSTSKPLATPGPNSKRGVPPGLVASALIVVILWGASTAAPLLVPLSIAGLLAVLISPGVRGMQRLHVPESLAIGLSILLLLLPVSIAGYYAVIQGQALAQDFPALVSSIDRMLANAATSAFGRRFGLSEVLSGGKLADRLADSAGQGIQLLLTGLAALLALGSQAFLVLLFTIVMLASRDHLRRSSERLLAVHEGIEAAAMLEDIIGLVQRFLISRSLIVVLIALADVIILEAFGLKYALLLGAFLGLMTMVPAVGFILSVIPPMIVSLAMKHSLVSMFGMVSALAVMSLIEANVLTPKLVGKSLNINALTTFIGMFAGGMLWGIWGMVLSIPMLGILRIALSASPRLEAWGELLADKPANGRVPRFIRIRRSGSA